jgi:periplasmic glucans biosynthesis protein
MSSIPAPVASLSRRQLILSTGAALAAPMLPGRARAAEGLPEGSAFGFDSLSEQMRQRATEAYVRPEPAEGFAGDLDYDGYRRIRFRPERTRWHQGLDTPGGAGFGLQAFHAGWLFGEPVRLFDVTDGTVREMRFTTDDFAYDPELGIEVPPGEPLPGVAGFRLHYPLNRPDVQDEVVAFLGASYFRALGQGSAYGISARGLAIDTALGQPEEFPRFTAFYLARPPAGEASVTVYAALDSDSVTGAYRFVMRPGAATEMDVTARLFFRTDVEQVGVAPLTSMFLYDDKNRAAFDDFRPRVHDSEGLAIRRTDGIALWRPLNNPTQLANSYFAEPLQRFGLHQRDRVFDNYQDAEARYERRPSLDVEPIGDWGPGAVRLVEIPSALEANDNIVAFFVPGEGRADAGEAREYGYRLHWGDLAGPPADGLAPVVATRAGHGGVAGVDPEPDLRKFVIDFACPSLPPRPDPQEAAPLQAVVTCMGGEIRSQVLDVLPDGATWRLVLDVHTPQGGVAEMTAHLAGQDRRLTETWVYQWVNAG